MSKTAKGKKGKENSRISADRLKPSDGAFSQLDVDIETLETSLLLLSSEEESVLVKVFKHIMDFIHKEDTNINDIKEHNMLDLLIQKEFFINHESPIIKRFALYITNEIMKTVNVLTDINLIHVMDITNLCLRFYLQEYDLFCLEYLSMILNKCMDDDRITAYVLENLDYLEKIYELVEKTDNPDILLHSIEAIYKMLRVQEFENRQNFAYNPQFPIDRIICDVTNQYSEIRDAVLKVIKILIPDDSEMSPFARVKRSETVLQQLATVFCNDEMEDNEAEVIKVLTIAMKSEKLSEIFFELNIFDKIVQNIYDKPDRFPMEKRCKIISIFTENAKFEQFLPRIHAANITDFYLECLLIEEPAPATHVITGLIRLMKHVDAANRIVQAYGNGLIAKILKIIENYDNLIKTREECVSLLILLLEFAFHPTASDLFYLEFPEVAARIFAQSLAFLSVELVLLLLELIENLAINEEYRIKLGESEAMTRNMALLLKKSFAHAQIVSGIFHCLCTILEEPLVRSVLLKTYISESMRRGLKSVANTVKAAVTNFALAACKYQEMINNFIINRVLEVLIMNQIFSHCVPTWNQAIDCILSKDLSIKFCIRNYLDFMDDTANIDFLVSKRKFKDFRTFLSILNQNVSPLDPVLVVNYHRPRNPSFATIHVPNSCFREPVDPETVWCYCRSPGDSHLPLVLENLKNEFSKVGLYDSSNFSKRNIDFENLPKRVKIIADIVAQTMGKNLKILDLNTDEECSRNHVYCHLKDLAAELHCTFIPLGMIRTGCQFERAIFFKSLADQVGLPCTLKRNADGDILFNEIPLPLERNEEDMQCDKKTMKFMPWSLLRPTHIVDLMFNVGQLYPLQSRQALQYLKLY